MKGAGLERREGAMQQRPAGAAAQKIRRDIERIDLAVETQALVARRPESRQPDHAMGGIVRHQHGALLDGALDAGGMNLNRHAGEQAVGKNGGIRVLPGLDIEARERNGIPGPRLSKTQREITHDRSVTQEKRRFKD